MTDTTIEISDIPTILRQRLNLKLVLIGNMRKPGRVLSVDALPNYASLCVATFQDGRRKEIYNDTKIQILLSPNNT